ncbi:MAG: patatin-like phospholipase family protein [Candidatus Hydrogenedentota bacterium]
MKSPLLIALLLAAVTMPQADAAGKADYDRAVAWRAFLSEESRPLIGVALGGGGARGMAHIGVLRSLRGAGIPVEAVTGTSIGSFIGALYATGADIDKIENLALQTNWSNLIELRMSRIGFFSTRRLERFINFHLQFLQNDILRLPSKNAADEYVESDLNDLSFDELRIPFACTATDLYSGSVVIFDTGSVAEAIRASCSIPGLFEPAPYGDRLLVDGGVILNLPVSLCRDLGAGIVIGIDLESDTPSQIGGLVEVLAQIIKIQGRTLSADERLGADDIIQPRCAAISMTDLNRTADAIREGAIAAGKEVERIKDNLLQRRSGGTPVSSEMRASDRHDSDEALRHALLPIRGRSATALGGQPSSAMVAAAIAAAKLGLYREALEYIEVIPLKDRSVDCLLAEAMSHLRMRNRILAQESVERLSARDINPDRYWELAAAALDVRFDEIAESIIRRIAPNS